MLAKSLTNKKARPLPNGYVRVFRCSSSPMALQWAIDSFLLVPLDYPDTLLDAHVSG